MQVEQVPRGRSVHFHLGRWVQEDSEGVHGCGGGRAFLAGRAASARAEATTSPCGVMNAGAT